MVEGMKLIPNLICSGTAVGGNCNSPYDRERMKNRNVQIPYELFFQLLQYFLMENYESEEIIRQGLERKLNTMVNRELYSKYKTAPTEEEREKYRQEYLDRRGIPENFRW